MPFRLTSLADLRAASFDTVIDVRSPGEFAVDHMPGALSLPVLDDAERAQVGTIYKQVAPFAARRIGAALVARNAAAHIEGPLADKPGGWRPLIYCWRGGQRSNSFAAILAQIGWRAEVVEGGYRAYRRLVADAMHDRLLPHRLILLDGNTGTAKTELLHMVAARGVQVVDLEGLAAHRGSLFGAVAHPQPTQKAFEGRLAAAFEGLDPARPVLVEAESSKIGNLLIPPSVWAAMRAAPRLDLSAPLSVRARYLTRAYADMVADPAALRATLGRLVPFHGHERIAGWQDLARRGAFEDLAADLMRHHYDPRYLKSRAGRGVEPVRTLALDDLSADHLKRAADRLVVAVGDADDRRHSDSAPVIRPARA